MTGSWYQKGRRLLMAPPFHYAVTYKINPWMAPEEWAKGSDAHYQRAFAQWLNLFKALQEMGCDIDLQTPESHVPDFVFSANAALVLGGKALIAKFRHPERQGEEALNENYFAKAGFEVIKPKSYFEGAGDALYDHERDVIWMGSGPRSDLEAAQEIEKTLGCKVEVLELVTEKFYHVDTCFCPLTSGHVLYHPAAFSPASQQKLKDMIGDKLIEVDGKDADHFCCNAVCYQKSIAMPPCGDALRQTLEGIGYKLYPVELDAFLLAGGAAKCLTLRLDE